MKKLISVLALVFALTFGLANTNDYELSKTNDNPLVEESIKPDVEKASCPGGAVGGGGSCTG